LLLAQSPTQLRLTILLGKNEKDGEAMPKTKRDLIYALAEKVGGDQGQRMREVIESSLFKDLKQLDIPLSDEEYTGESKKMENFPEFLARLKQMRSEKPGSWGLPN
jgi:hypothetical protein